MPWTERKLTRGFGAELTGAAIGLDLPQADARAVHDIVMQAGVAVLPGQDLSDDALYDFAASLGAVVPMPDNIAGIPSSKVMPLTNLDQAGQLRPADDWWVRQNMANELWHLDLTFMRPRATISMLYGLVVPPEGGDTEFCDTRLAWEALSPAEQARLASLTALHSVTHSRRTYGFTDYTDEVRRMPAIERPLVAFHAESGRTTLNLASHIVQFSGLSEGESAELLADLTERATVPANTYAHRWRAGDLLLWDNRCVMHRARPWKVMEHGRDMRGVRLYDPADA